MHSWSALFALLYKNVKVIETANITFLTIIKQDLTTTYLPQITKLETMRIKLLLFVSNQVGYIKSICCKGRANHTLLNDAAWQVYIMRSVHIDSDVFWVRSQ